MEHRGSRAGGLPTLHTLHHMTWNSHTHSGATSDGINQSMAPVRATPASPILRLAAEARHHTWLLVSGTACLLASSLFELVLTRTAGAMLDLLPEAAAGRWDALDAALYKLAGCLVAVAVVKHVGEFLMRLAGERLVVRTRKQLFLSLLRQPVPAFDETSTGELVSVLFAEVEAVQIAVTRELPGMIRELAACLFSAAGMAHISLRITLGAASAGPAIGLVAALIGGRVSRLAREHQEELGVTSALASESLASVRAIKAFAREETVAARLGERIDACASRALHEMALHKVWNGSNILMAGCATIIILRQAGSALERGEISVGDLAALGVLGVAVGSSANEASKKWAVARASAAKGAHALALLDSVAAKAVESAADEARAGAEEAVCAAELRIAADGGVRIEFEEVRFTYALVGRLGATSGADGEGGTKGGATLDGVSFEAAAGRTTALCGPSGCGKSTCLSLLLRYYTASSGAVRMGGVALAELPNAWLRTHLSVVPQEPALFEGTILENILFGASDEARATWGDEKLRDRAVRAAIDADAHSFITQQPAGYETPVGERGSSLSGGQRQRIAIARALLRDSRVLLLDEATAALDNASEKVVQAALHAAARRATVLVVAHRLSTIRAADLIVVLDDGRVAEAGTHAALSALGGLYSRLASAGDGAAPHS